MAGKDDPKDPGGPSLELPSLGFGRKKRARRQEAAPAPPPVTEPAAPAAPPPAPPPETAPVVEDRPAETLTEQPAAYADDSVDHEAPRATRSRPRLPRIGAVPAALVTGLVVGLLTAGLVWASQGLCELVRGTSSCGNTGFLLLVAVLVVAGWLGGTLLRAFGVADGGSTSFLAMGLVAVALMLFLSDQLLAWWMVAVVPAVAMLAYVLAHRVTTAMVEPGGPEMHR